MNNLVQPPYRRAFGALGREASRAFDRLSHAVEWHQTGTMMSTAKAPYRLVHQDVDLSIMHFRSSQALVHSTPVLLIPPLGVTPEIYDLRPEHSFVRALLNAGLDLYMIDFGVPDLSDRQKALTDYAMRLLPQAIDITLTDSGTPSLSLVGYSMGGVMALLYAGDEGKTAPVDALVTVGSPIDMRGLFPWDRVISLARRELDAVVATFGVLPPQLMRLGFRLSAPFKTVTVYRDLMVNMWNREWIVSYEAINSWIDTFIPFPGDAMRQFFHFIEGNRIVDPFESGLSEEVLFLGEGRLGHVGAASDDGAGPGVDGVRHPRGHVGHARVVDVVQGALALLFIRVEVEEQLMDVGLNDLGWVAGVDGAIASAFDPHVLAGG